MGQILVIPLLFVIFASGLALAALKGYSLNDPARLTDSLAALNMLVMVVGFSGLSLTMVTIANDYAVIRREFVHSGVSAVNHVLSRYLSRAPLAAGIGLIAGVVFWLFGAEADPSTFIKYTGSLAVYGLASCALGILVSCFTSRVETVVYAVVSSLILLVIASEIPLRTSGTMLNFLSFVVPSGYVSGSLGAVSGVAEILRISSSEAERSRLWNGGNWYWINIGGMVGLTVIYLGASVWMLKRRMKRPH